MLGARKLGEILVADAGVATSAIDAALDAQRAPRERRQIGAILIELGAVRQERLAQAVASQFGLRYVDPLVERVDPVALWRVPPEVAERLQAMPLRSWKGVVLAMAQPRASESVREMSALLGVQTPIIVVAAADRITEAIRRHYDTSPAMARACRKLRPEERPPVLSPTGLELDEEEVVVRLSRGTRDVATALLAHALELGASELRMDGGVLSHVYDGVRARVMELSPSVALPLAERLAFLGGLEREDARRCIEVQSGIVVGDRMVPTLSRAVHGPAGPSVRVRFVPSPRRAADLGMTPSVESAWTDLCRGSGLILLVGPEGSGCRTTAAAAGKRLRNLKDAAGLDAALTAAEGGEVVFGRVFAEGVPEAISMLMESGVAPARLAMNLRGALTQRLVRRVCVWCSAGSEPVRVGELGATAPELDVCGCSAPVAGPGCPACRYRGLDGVRAIFELVVVDAKLRNAIADEASLSRLGSLAVAVDRRCIRAAGIARAAAGEVPLAELRRVVPPRPEWTWGGGPRPREDGQTRVFEAAGFSYGLRLS